MDRLAPMLTSWKTDMLDPILAYARRDSDDPANANVYVDRFSPHLTECLSDKLLARLVNDNTEIDPPMAFLPV
jgi:hypothetical protein